jgi:hypothetical protein
VDAKSGTGAEIVGMIYFANYFKYAGKQTGIAFDAE